MDKRRSVFALTAVPEAVAKLSQLLEVTFVNSPVEGVTLPIGVPLMEPPRMVALLELSANAVNVVPEAVVNPSQVEVVFVPVPLVHVKLVGLSVLIESVPMVAEFANKLVEVTLVEVTFAVNVAPFPITVPV